MLNEVEVLNLTALKNKFSKKTCEKFWQFKNKPYLCIRFRNGSFKEEFFERFRYEQASSTILTYCQKTETVNKLIDRFGS